MATLNVHAFGPAGGAPVLVVHGVRNNGARHRLLAATALPEARVLAVDLRGHGDSTWLPPWDAGRHVADLLDTLDAHGLDSVPVMGHSFGGLLALRLAAVAPARVSRIALLDPAVALDPAACLAQAEATLLDDGWSSREEALAARRAMRPPHSRDTADDDLASFLAEGPDGRFRLRFSRAAVVAAWSEMAHPPPSLAGWPGQVLLLRATREAFVTPALVDSLEADLGRRLRLHDVDSGHMLFWDALDETAALVGPFLAGA